MFWWIVFLIFFIVGLAVSVVIILRKIPQLRILNTEALPEEKMRQTKESLFQKRLERTLKEHLSFLSKNSAVVGREASRFGRRLVQKIYTIEQKYRQLQKHGSEHSDTEAIRRLTNEALDLEKKEEYFEAEKRYIEILSRHPKHVKAYEGLGKLYLLDRKYNQARETFNFALKLKPDDASVHAALGELETIESNHEVALQEFFKSVELRPNNPRYLDFFIEAAILAKNFPEARRGLKKLSEVNPENQKLSDFETRILNAELAVGNNNSGVNNSPLQPE